LAEIGKEQKRRGKVEVFTRSESEQLFQVVSTAETEGDAEHIRMAAERGHRIEGPDRGAGGNDLNPVRPCVPADRRYDLFVDEAVKPVLQERTVIGGGVLCDPRLAGDAVAGVDLDPACLE